MILAPYFRTNKQSFPREGWRLSRRLMPAEVAVCAVYEPPRGLHAVSTAPPPGFLGGSTGLKGVSTGFKVTSTGLKAASTQARLAEARVPRAECDANAQRPGFRPSRRGGQESLPHFTLTVWPTSASFSRGGVDAARALHDAVEVNLMDSRRLTNVLIVQGARRGAAALEAEMARNDNQAALVAAGQGQAPACTR
jgi:hypothetical protein